MTVENFLVKKILILQGFRTLFCGKSEKFSTLSTVEKVDIEVFNKFSTSFQQSKNSVLIGL